MKLSLDLKFLWWYSLAMNNPPPQVILTFQSQWAKLGEPMVLEDATLSVSYSGKSPQSYTCLQSRHALVTSYTPSGLTVSICGVVLTLAPRLLPQGLNPAVTNICCSPGSVLALSGLGASVSIDTTAYCKPALSMATMLWYSEQSWPLLGRGAGLRGLALLWAGD